MTFEKKGRIKNIKIMIGMNLSYFYPRKQQSFLKNLVDFEK